MSKVLEGFDLLKSNVFREKKSRELNTKKYSIKLPPIFNLFLVSFEWRMDLIANESFFFMPFLEGGEIDFNGWNYNAIFLKPIVYRQEEMEERGLVLIASSYRGVYLGTKGEDIDKVFSTTSSVEGSIIEIASNIFEFVRGLTNNVGQTANSEEEMRRSLIALGYEGEDLEYEINDWKVYNKSKC